MRIAPVMLALGAAGCSFEPNGVPADGDGGGGDGGGGDADGPIVDAGPDARLDAGFDLSRCPSVYDITIGASKYRVRPNSDTYAMHYLNCADDSPEDITHMVVISDALEAAALRAHDDICDLDDGDCDTFWTGVFAPDAATFATATGEPVFAVWDAGEPGDVDQPRTAVTYNPLTGLNVDHSIDTGITSVRSVCECDGREAVPLPAAR